MTIDAHIMINICFPSYIEGPIPKDLGDLVQLKELFLDDNELTGSIPTELGNLSGVDYIALANNNIGESIFLLGSGLIVCS